MNVFKWGVLGLLAAGVLLLVGCGSNPNEHVQSNEFFRPAAPLVAEVAPNEGQQAQAQEQVAEEAQQGEAQEDGLETEEGQQAAAQQEGAEAEEAQPAEEGQEEAAVQQAAAAEEESSGGGLETSTDVIRRFVHPSYGYSFELICSPFCDAQAAEIDFVNFFSETGRALIGVRVLLDDGRDGEELVREAFSVPAAAEWEERTAASTVTGEAAERFDWLEDRRATGGFQVQWHALLVRLEAEGLVILMRAGAVMENYDESREALERALGSFILPAELGARPGRYARFDFSIEYDVAEIAQEFGQPTNQPPSEEAGIFVLQTAETGLKAVLTWQQLGAAFYDGDTAIEQSLRDSLGTAVVTGYRAWTMVDGKETRTADSQTPLGEVTVPTRSYAWYCEETGREFALHVLDAEDADAAAAPLLASFQCDPTSDAGESE